MLFLTHDEVRELTGRTRYHAQRRVLTAMRIDFRARPDGRPLVLRARAEELLGHKATPAPQTPEPNWEALDGST